MTDTLKQAEELIRDIGYLSYYSRVHTCDREKLDKCEKELLCLISKLIEENERLNTLLNAVHGALEHEQPHNALRFIEQESEYRNRLEALDELTQLGQEMGDYDLLL